MGRICDVGTVTAGRADDDFVRASRATYRPLVGEFVERGWQPTDERYPLSPQWGSPTVAAHGSHVYAS